MDKNAKIFLNKKSCVSFVNRRIRMKYKYSNILKYLTDYAPMAASIVNADPCQIELYNDHLLRLFYNETIPNSTEE